MLTVAGGFGVQLALLVSGILVARLLGVEDRGYLALFWVIALLIAFVATTGLHSSVTYWIARDPGCGLALARLIARVGAVQALLGVILQAGILFYAVHDAGDEVRLAALISLGVVPMMVVVFYAMAFLQGLERFRGWTLIRLLPALLYTVAVVFLALIGHATLVAVTAGWVIAYVVSAVVALVWARAAVPAADRGHPAPAFGELQRFGAKAFLGSASPTDSLQLDQLLVGLFLSASDLGLYVVGLAFTNLPRIVAQSVGFVVFPDVAKISDHDRARRAMWVSTGVTALVIAVIVGVLEIGSGWLVPLFFGDEFDGAIGLTRILLISGALVSVRRVLSDAARGAGYPGLGSVAEVAAATVLIPLMAVLAATGGVNGVAWALVIAAAVGLAVLVGGLLLDSARSRRRGLEVGVTVDPPAPIRDAAELMGSLEDVQRNWEAYAAADPMWAALMDPEKRGRRWDAGEFFATGDEEIATVLGHLAKIGVEPDPGADALDFGCGIGRLTQALARRFGSATGVDISPKMVELAHGASDLPNTSFVVNAAGDLGLFEDGRFGFVYSSVVLQHLEPRYSTAYIREFARLLEPGGVAVFQIPDRIKGDFVARLRRRLRVRGRLRGEPVAEMHCVPEDRVRELLADSGAVVADVQVTNSTDLEFVGGLQYLSAAPSVGFVSKQYTVRREK